MKSIKMQLSNYYADSNPEHVTQVAAIYLIGSTNINADLPNSDIDLIVVPKNPDKNADAQLQQLIRKELTPHVPNKAIAIHFFHLPISETLPYFTVQRTLLYGKEVLNDCPIQSWREYAIMHSIYAMTLMKDFRHTQTLTLPLNYPDINQSYYGYTQQTRLAKTEHDAIRNIYAINSRCIAVLLALEKQLMFATKQDLMQYAISNITKDMGTQSKLIFTNIYQKWRYHMPTTVDEQKTLRKICRHTLIMENLFLKHFYVQLQRDPELAKLAKQNQIAAELIY